MGKRKRKIRIEDFEDQFADYEQLRDYVNHQLVCGRFEIRNRGRRRTTHLYSLPADYWLIEIVPDLNEDELQAEIRHTFPLGSDQTYYLKNLNAYNKRRREIQQLIAWYIQPGQRIIIPEKERFFEIWKNEKFSSDAASRLLKNIGLPPDALCCVRKEDPSARLFGSSTPVVLVVENKDSFWSIRELLEEKQQEFLETGIQGVFYGNGRSVSSSFQDALFCGLLDSSSLFLYWGDLDPAGISIFQKFCERFPALRIEPWVQGYRQMLSLAEQMGGWTYCKEDQSVYCDVFHGGVFWDFFTGQ